MGVDSQNIVHHHHSFYFFAVVPFELLTNAHQVHFVVNFLAKNKIRLFIEIN